MNQTEELTAFEAYLLKISPIEAIQHILDCLVRGEPQNEAWALMTEFNGEDWSCDPAELPKLIARTLGELTAREAQSRSKHLRGVKR